MTNEIKIGETTFFPDTHCVDADTGLDVWSFSPGLVREMLAAGVQSNDGCGACGDGCSERGSCRVKDESPELPTDNESLTEIRKQRDELLSALEEATDVVIGHYGTEGRLAKNCLAAIASAKGGAV